MLVLCRRGNYYYRVEMLCLLGVYMRVRCELVIDEHFLITKMLSTRFVKFTASKCRVYRESDREDATAERVSSSVSASERAYLTYSTFSEELLYRIALLYTQIRIPRKIIEQRINT